MKKSIRHRPELESLESHLLLSTVAAPVTLNLTGSTEVSPSKSNVHVIQANSHGIAVKITSKGQLATLGPVTVTEVEKVNPNGTLTSTYTVSTARGNLVLSGHAVGTGGVNTSTSTEVTGSVTFDYTITGGTKAYAKASGSGSVIETSTIYAKGHPKGSLSFVAQQVPPSTPFVDNLY